MKSWKIIPFGDHALTIRFEGPLSVSNNQQVHQLWVQIKRLNWENLLYGIPSNLDLTLVFKQAIQLHSIERAIDTILQKAMQSSLPRMEKQIRIPVCYDLEFGLDLEELSTKLALPVQEIIQLHQAQTYQVFSMGFLPGFAYLGLLPEALQIPRKTLPRTKVPAGSVAIAAQQTGIYPQDSPGGWHILGRTPIPIFDPGEAIPFLFSPGDQVRFESISAVSFREMVHQVHSGQFKWSMLYD
ncbi:MAG: 5-oxoprolinase subunit PxpB [Bacteroidota bacterium]